MVYVIVVCFFFQAEDGIRDLVRSRGLGDVYKRQNLWFAFLKMKRIWRRFDGGFLVVLLISLLAVWPLLSRASLPEGTDAELHIFRLHELGALAVSYTHLTLPTSDLV